MPQTKPKKAVKSMAKKPAPKKLPRARVGSGTKKSSKYLASNFRLLSVAFIVIFAGVGGYFLWRSFADSPGPTWQVAAPEVDHAPNSVLLKFKDNVPQNVQDKLLARYSARTQSEIPQLGVKVLHVPDQAVEAVTEALGHNPAVQFAEMDSLTTAQVVPNDPYFLTGTGALSGGEWGSKQTQAPAAWDTTTGSSAVTVAIVDSGIVPTQPDLVPNLVPGWNVLTGTADTTDGFGHGTEVAGVAVSASNNAQGVAAYCWKCGLMPIKTYVSSNAYDSDLAKGITWATDHGARVINISMAGTGVSSALNSAVSYAVAHGALVVAAAGNNGNTTPTYPASSPGAIAVAATDQNDTFNSYSDYGPWVTLAAPGSTPTTLPSGAYGAVGGTSVASPAVAGIAALLFSAKPSATVADVKNALLNTTDPTTGTHAAAHGRVNASKALAALLGGVTSPADTTPPAATIASPPNSATLAGQVSVSVTASDNVGVSKVELYRNGTLVGATTTSPYSFYWDTTASTNGSYTLTAKAYDAAGNAASSSAVTVSVNNTAVVGDTVAPTVSISSPTSGAAIGSAVTVTASASDNVGVTSIEVYLDGVLRASATTSTVSSKLNTRKLTSGTHTIVVKAYDSAGNVATSSVQVTK